MEWPRHVRAGVLTLRGHHAAAVSEYRRSLESDPTAPPALIAVLPDCRARGAVAEAIDAANRALSRDASNFIALDGLAWAYLQQEDHHRARPIVEKAVRAFEELDTGSAFSMVPAQPRRASERAVEQGE